MKEGEEGKRERERLEGFWEEGGGKHGKEV